MFCTKMRGGVDSLYFSSELFELSFCFFDGDAGKSVSWIESSRGRFLFEGASTSIVDCSAKFFFKKSEVSYDSVASNGSHPVC